MKTPRRKKQTTENFIKDVRRKTRRIFSSEQKIQIVMEAMRAELSLSEICRKNSISDAQFYNYGKDTWINQSEHTLQNPRGLIMVMV